MSIVTISTPFNIDVEFQIAAFHKRLLAWLVDLVIICLYYYLMILLLPSNAIIANTELILLIVIPVFLYHPLMEIFANGQTLGKKLIGVKVIDKSGEEPTIGQYLIRWILSLGNLFIYVIPYMFLLNGVWAAFFLIWYIPDVFSILLTAKSQRIGDLAAGTILIDRRYKTNINETIYLEIEEDDYKPVYPQVMRLTDRDINGIRNLLDVKSNNRDTEIYIEQVVYRIREILHIQADMEAREFLQQLLKDYNFLTRK